MIIFINLHSLPSVIGNKTIFIIFHFYVILKQHKTTYKNFGRPLYIFYCGKNTLAVKFISYSIVWPRFKPKCFFLINLKLEKSSTLIFVWLESSTTRDYVFRFNHIFTKLWEAVKRIKNYRLATSASSWQVDKDFDSS